MCQLFLGRQVKMSDGSSIASPDPSEILRIEVFKSRARALISPVAGFPS